MSTTTHTQHVLALAAQRGLLRASHLQELGIARVVLSRLTASGQLERVGRGVYRLPDAQGSEHESLATIAVKVPQAVFCLLTALQIHELTTQLPRQVWIAMPQGSHAPKMDYPPVKMVQFSGEAYAIDADAVVQVQATLRRRILRAFVGRGLLENFEAKEMLAYQHSGFSVDASVCIEAHDRAALERLLRYCARPPFAIDRLRKAGAELAAQGCGGDNGALGAASLGNALPPTPEPTPGPLTPKRSAHYL